MKNIIFIGFKGCGKTTIGRDVAKRLSLDFLDSDALIESQYFKLKGERLSFRKIFKKEGSDYFRNLELEIAKELIKKDNKVISLGGGTLFLDFKITTSLSSQNLIYLYVNPDVLYKRICKNGIPAILNKESPHESFQKLFFEREQLFEKCAKIKFDNTDCSVHQAVESVLKELE